MMKKYYICTDEWKFYQLQYIFESWYREAGSEEYNQINHYWWKVLQKKKFVGSAQYTILPKFVKTCIYALFMEMLMMSVPYQKTIELSLVTV